MLFLYQPKENVRTSLRRAFLRAGLGSGSCCRGFTSTFPGGRPGGRPGRLPVGGAGLLLLLLPGDGALVRGVAAAFVSWELLRVSPLSAVSVGADPPASPPPASLPGPPSASFAASLFPASDKREHHCVRDFKILVLKYSVVGLFNVCSAPAITLSC